MCRHDNINDCHSFTQLHHVKWPDFKTPTPGTLTRLLKTIAQQESQMRMPSALLPPIVVHCSAGVGRAGTFVCVQKLLEHALASLCSKTAHQSNQNTLMLQFDRLVLDIRRQRRNAVVTQTQFEFCARTAADVLRANINDWLQSDQSQPLCEKLSLLI